MGFPDLTIHHNTWGATTDQWLMFFGSNTVPNCTVRDNIGYATPTYGPIWKAEGGLSNTGALDASCGPGLWTVKNNICLVRQFDANLTNNYNNKTASTLASIGFVNQTAGDYTLATGSQYKGIGTGGSDPGVNMARLTAITDGVIAGIPTGS